MHKFVHLGIDGFNLPSRNEAKLRKKLKYVFFILILFPYILLAQPRPPPPCPSQKAIDKFFNDTGWTPCDIAAGIPRLSRQLEGLTGAQQDRTNWYLQRMLMNYKHPETGDVRYGYWQLGKTENHGGGDHGGQDHTHLQWMDEEAELPVFSGDPKNPFFRPPGLQIPSRNPARRPPKSPLPRNLFFKNPPCAEDLTGLVFSGDLRLNAQQRRTINFENELPGGLQRSRPAPITLEELPVTYNRDSYGRVGMRGGSASLGTGLYNRHLELAGSVAGQLIVEHCMPETYAKQQQLIRENAENEVRARIAQGWSPTPTEFEQGFNGSTLGFLYYIFSGGKVYHDSSNDPK